MYLSRIRVKSYKSFSDSGDIFFKPGINVIIGSNNSGKTALLEAINLQPLNNPHKRAEHKSGQTLSPSTIEFTLTVSKEELRGPLFQTMTVPAPANGRTEEARLFFNDARDNKGLDINAHISDELKHDFNYGYEPTERSMISKFMTITWQGSQYGLTTATAGNDPKASIGFKVMQSFTGSIYRFVAERVKLSQMAINQSTSNLQTNASNLAAVLHHLQSHNPTRFKRLIRHVTDVIPSVRWVTVVPNGNVLEIKIWPIEPETEREDLAVNLSQAGTGIGQVLAMIYIAFTSEEPRLIVIDEPQAFLHPGAIKKLMGVFHLFSQHQYIISTHSPDILSVALPSTIVSLEYREGVTSAKSLNRNQTTELRNALYEIGVRPGDVLFASSILWVEGATEALSFPLILKMCDLPVRDITILPLVNTGDLKSKKHVRKHAKVVFEIYSKLSAAHAMAPPVVGMVLDTDDLRAEDMTELNRLSEGLLEFLPRRLYENYLLNPDAIAAVANNQENFSEAPLTADQVSFWVEQKRKEGGYLDAEWKDKKDGLSEERWLTYVDGAKLLEDLFRHFSGVVSYSKTTHSVELTAWIVNNRPDYLKELRDFLESILTR